MAAAVIDDQEGSMTGTWQSTGGGDHRQVSL
jgi:hypothetical protein